MAKPGPRPTPSDILKLKGSTRAGRARAEPQPERVAPSCPAWLDADAKACWKSIVPQLEAMRVLGRIDGNTLTRYCADWSRWKKALATLQEKKDTYELLDQNGNVRCVVQRPEVAIANRLAASLLRIEAEFGMTPSARARVTIPPEVDEDDDDDLARQREPESEVKR